MYVSTVPKVKHIHLVERQTESEKEGERVANRFVQPYLQSSILLCAMRCYMCQSRVFLGFELRGEQSNMKERKREGVRIHLFSQKRGQMKSTEKNPKKIAVKV